MLFGRRIVLDIAEKELKIPDLEIEFKVEFSDEDDGNVGYIRLYNLSEKTIDKIEKGNNFLLKAGYKNDVGILLPGVVEQKHSNWEEVNKVTTLTIGDNTDAWLNKTVNKTWKSGKKASDIAPDIAKSTGLNIGEINIKDDVKYPKGKTFSTTCREALNEITEDTNSKLHVSRGRIYLRPRESTIQTAIVLDSKTGLIASPELSEDSDGKIYTVKMLLNYRVQTDSLLKIDSKTISGNYRVISGEHTAEGDDFSTQVEVEEV